MYFGPFWRRNCCSLEYLYPSIIRLSNFCTLLSKVKMFYLILLIAVFSGCSAEDPRLRWCCTSQHEYYKCIRLSFHSDVFRKEFHCLKFDGTVECARAIIGRRADVMFLDGGDIFRYRKGISVIASENYGVEGDASYYAVAVVKSGSFPELSMLNLEGAKSCHTGIGKSSGWNTPMGWIARHHNSFGPDGKLQLYDPFSVSCAPGAANSIYQASLPDPSNWSKWCALCIGDEYGDHVCDRDSDERYYGYSGAFQCMKDGTGEVAFVKHVTVPLEEQDNFQLLCEDGTRAHPSAWRDCFLARIPAHGMIMRNDTDNDIANKALATLQETKATTTREVFFEKNGMGRNLLWKSSTISFDATTNKEPSLFLGQEYYCNMFALSGENVPADCV